MARETRSDFYPAPIVDQNTRPGAITRLIIFIVVLTGAAIVFGLFRERLGEPFLLGMLGVLAMIGVGFLFATAIGFIQVAPRSTADELSKCLRRLADAGPARHRRQGPRRLCQPRLCRDDRRHLGRRCQDAWKACCPTSRRPSPVVYRLASGLRDGQAGDGEFRLQQAIRPGAEPGARWYRMRARTFTRSRPAPAAVCLAARRHLGGAGRAGALLPRSAEGDRPSRPCAGRLLRRRRRRPRHLHQRDAGRMAGHRSGELHAGRDDAARRSSPATAWR